MSPFHIHFCLLSIRNGVLIQVLIKKSNAVCVFESLCPTFSCGSYYFPSIFFSLVLFSVEIHKKEEFDITMSNRIAGAGLH